MKTSRNVDAHGDDPGCGNCRHFGNSALEVESALPGLCSLSSAYAAVRADDGVCRRHRRYVAASSICTGYDLRQ